MKFALNLLIVVGILNAMPLFAGTTRGSDSSVGDAYPIACLSFDETQLATIADANTQGDWDVVSGAITVYDVNGDVNNQAVANQILGILKDYGFNSHCANAGGYGTPDFSQPSYESFLKDGQFPKGTSSHDGTCTSFNPRNLTVRKTNEDGGSFGVDQTLSELVDPVSGVSIYSTYGNDYSAFQSFLINGQAARICSIRLYQPQDIYQNREFYYFTKN